jgi:hypothetical protein
LNFAIRNVASNKWRRQFLIYPLLSLRETNQKMSFIWKQQIAEAKAQEIPLRRAAAFAFLTKVLGVVAVLKAVPYFLDLVQGDPSPPPPTTQTLPPLSLPPSPSV